MDFLFGVIATLFVSGLTLFIVTALRRRPKIKLTSKQSFIFESIKPAVLIMSSIKEPKPSQASRYLDRNKMTVLVLDDKAYWIKDNAVFEADFSEGLVDQENVKVVDTMGMDKVELDKLSYIVDKLTKGDNNDRSYPGY